MQFTQFKFPNGRHEEVSIDMPKDIEEKALELHKSGWRFEIECFPDTQTVNMDCCDAEEQLSMRLVPNGPKVPIAVEELVNEAHERWTKRDKPQAECDSCRAKSGTPVLCTSCYHNRSVIDSLKEEIEELRRHELSVAYACGVVYEADGHNAQPGPRDIVLETIKAHRRVWEQAQAANKFLKAMNAEIVNAGTDSRPALIPNEWREETLRKLKELEDRVLSSLTPREKKVLEKRMGVKR